MPRKQGILSGDSLFQWQRKWYRNLVESEDTGDDQEFLPPNCDMRDPCQASEYVQTLPSLSEPVCPIQRAYFIVNVLERQ